MFKRIADAVALIEASLTRDSFPSKASQKQALAACQQVIEQAHRQLQEALLAERAEGSFEFAADAGRDQYYWKSACHTWSAKTEALFADRPEFVAAARAVVGQYLTLKALPVVILSKEKSLEQKIEMHVARTFRDLKAEIDGHVRLIDIFKRLNVGATQHWVTNQYGTTFPRFAYYLNGQRTALGIILVSLDKAERDGILEIVDGAYRFANEAGA